MLIFEKGKPENGIKCGIRGTLGEVTTDLIFCIRAVHQAVKTQDPEAAAQLREYVELACKHGSVLNKGIFEHFEDDDWMKNEMEKEDQEQEEKLQTLEDTLRKIADMLKEDANGD